MHALLLAAVLASIDPEHAARALGELQTMCAADGGKLWGQSVCGRIVFADPRTRAAFTEGGSGSIPDTIGIANTAVEWDGRRWTMVMWPLPQATVARRVLLAHESFHRIQKTLGLPDANPGNAHLDSADARYWMRLEWRALARALATGEQAAVSDALAFRQRRRELAAGSAAEEERLLELNEGLSEYTGYALAIPRVRDRAAPLVRRLASADGGDQFARSFAYVSGPAWGTLIEMRDPRWTRAVRASSDLGEIARHAWRITKRPEVRPELYDGAAVHADEVARADKKRALFAEMKARLIDGPVLTIPLQKMQFTFDPNRVQPFGEHGTVYPTMEVRDVWGKIVISGGGLISPDFQRLVVPSAGDGWEITLADGWAIVDDSRPGDKTLSQR